MKLENQVCKKEQAIRLKELGIAQKSIFYHHQNFERPVFGEQWTTAVGKQHTTQVCNDKIHSFSAFTISELGQMLPSETCTQKTGSENSYYANWKWLNESERLGFGMFATEVEARAHMLICHLEKNLLSVDVCNERLLT